MARAIAIAGLQEGRRSWRGSASMARWLLAALVGIAIAACAPPQRVQTPSFGSQQIATPPTPRTIQAPISPDGRARVGILLPLSGQTAELGQAMLNAAQMAVFDTAGPNFDLIPRDTQGTANGARAAAQQAMGEGALMLLGPLFSESVRAAADVARPNGVNLIAFTTDADVAGQNTFVMGFLPSAQVERVMQYSASQGLRRFGVLAPDTAYGRLVAGAAQQTAPVLGGSVTLSQFYPAQSNDYSSVVEQVSASAGAFDTLILPDVGLRLRQVAPLIPYYGMRRTQLLGTGLWDGAGVQVEPALLGAWYAATPPQNRASFEERYEEQFGTPPPRLATLAYDAVALAVTMANQTRPIQYRRDVIADPNGYSGIDGIYRFGNSGLIERGLAVLEVTEDGARVLDPAPQSFQQFPPTF